jgi:hypothetical protein
MLLLPLFRGFSPMYITEHIQKYCSIEHFIKLPFQGYSFILIGDQMRELWPFCFRSSMLSRKFQNAQPSVIRPYPLVGTSD